eukprot:GHUV01007105.1.p1 GENE.GHUV01007105.1~~GHUV01007105.1.p1  ORF type:complete len:356 (+),score=121.12 GHUV01007105.1:733-1800(+)
MRACALSWICVLLPLTLAMAATGLNLMQGLGGRFSSLMPSDLSKPGALAFESIPARPDNSEAYAKPSVKRELARIFKRDGCHHCGSTRGPVIGDHMPPNKIVLGEKANINKILQEIPGIQKVRDMLGLAGRDGRPLQRFYPQCQKCSIKQATAMRNGKRVLVLHLRAPRYRSEHLSGVFVGIRHNVPPMDFPPQYPEPRRRSIAKWSPLALTAAAPADDNTDALNSSSSSHPMQQLLVQELMPASWDLSTQGYAPTPSNRSPQQQMAPPIQPQQYSMNHSRSSRHHEQKQSRQSEQMRMPGSAVQQLMPDAHQPQQEKDKQTNGVPLMIPVVPEHFKQRADAAFERHFSSQPSTR